MKSPLSTGTPAINALADQVMKKLTESADLYYHLVLIVAPAGSGKTDTMKEFSVRMGAPLLNVNLELSKKMLDLTARQRTMRLPGLLEEMVRCDGGKPALLDNIEILFDPRLQQDPLRLLQHLSRATALVVTWNGSVQGEHLFYAAPGHPEYRRYPVSELQVVTIEPRAIPAA